MFDNSVMLFLLLKGGFFIKAVFNDSIESGKRSETFFDQVFFHVSCPKKEKCDAWYVFVKFDKFRFFGHGNPPVRDSIAEEDGFDKS